MKTNMLQKLLPFLLLLLTFSACENSTNEDPTPVIEQEPTCYLKEETIEGKIASLLKLTINYHNASTVYHAGVLEYDENDKQFIATDDFHIIEYDTRGNIVKTEARDFRLEMRQRNLFEYNENKQLTKWKNFYWVNGVMQEGATRTYEYTSPTQLKKLTVTYPSEGTNSGNYYLYEYKNGLMHKVLEYYNNKLSSTRTLEYDAKKHPNRKHYLLHINFNRDLIGYPFQHNIVKETITVPNYSEVFVDYTATFTYNADGYPLTQRRHYVMEDKHVNYTYNYICKE